MQLEKAYDSIMYGQLNKRASGIAFGNVEVRPPELAMTPSRADRGQTFDRLSEKVRAPIM